MLRIELVVKSLVFSNYKLIKYYVMIEVGAVRENQN